MKSIREQIKSRVPKLTKQATVTELVEWAEARQRANQRKEREHQPLLPMDPLLDAIQYLEEAERHHGD